MNIKEINMQIYEVEYTKFLISFRGFSEWLCGGGFFSYKEWKTGCLWVIKNSNCL
ncbi:MAG: hypothetical protein J6C15_03375 [Bacteroidaceae bacterium]|nr:hypothetical protein [Bacteroidaceae bacterium]